MTGKTILTWPRLTTPKCHRGVRSSGREPASAKSLRARGSDPPGDHEGHHDEGADHER